MEGERDSKVRKEGRNVRRGGKGRRENTNEGE